MPSLRRTYIFLYNLFQFCCHTWILTNTITRFLTFGRDALADTFYTVGFLMSLCQILSILELFHIADGLERARLLPRFVQVMEKNILLLMVIEMEEIQTKPMVCVQFFLWNVADLLRYSHELLRLMDAPSVSMLWTRYTLWIPLYVLSAAAEGVVIYQALPRTKQAAPPSPPASPRVHLPLLLTVYLPALTVGACVTVWQLLLERRHQLEKWSKKTKKGK